MEVSEGSKNQIVYLLLFRYIPNVSRYDSITRLFAFKNHDTTEIRQTQFYRIMQ
jgi:hypothetical protein